MTLLDQRKFFFFEHVENLASSVGTFLSLSTSFTNLNDIFSVIRRRDLTTGGRIRSWNISQNIRRLNAVALLSATQMKATPNSKPFPFFIIKKMDVKERNICQFETDDFQVAPNGINILICVYSLSTADVRVAYRLLVYAIDSFTV